MNSNRPIADEPDAPKNLKATDWDKDHVDLKWELPVNDGGSPITGYLVEKKDKYGNWEKALEVRLQVQRWFIQLLENTVPERQLIITFGFLLP